MKLMRLVYGQFLVERFKILSLEDAINVSWASEHELDISIPSQCKGIRN